MWNYENWTNTEWIKEKERELQEIDTSFTLSSISGRCGDKAMAVGSTFKQKGNKDKIDRLIKMGWKLGRGSVRGGVKYVKIDTYF